MLPLPPVEPVAGWRRSLRLPRDYYVRVDSNDYSVHPGVIGRRVEISADLRRVQVTHHGQLVADHPRCWAAHQTITDPDHATSAETLRRAHEDSDHRRSSLVEATDVRVRALADYDTAFGLDDLPHDEEVA